MANGGMTLQERLFQGSPAEEITPVPRRGIYIRVAAVVAESVIVSEEISRSNFMREPRAAVMIVVEATWEDPGGTLRTIAARMENKSAGGACVRVETPIPVGSKLHIKALREQFDGRARYCISDGVDYLVGIQRVEARSAATAAPVLAPPPRLLAEVAAVPADAGKKKRSRPNRKTAKGVSKTPVRRKTRAPVAGAGPVETAVLENPPASGNRRELDSPLPNFAARLESVLQSKQHPSQPLTEQEKRIMRRKWLESALWSNKQESGKTQGNGKEDSSQLGNDGDAHAIALTPAPGKILVDGAAEILRSQVEYLSMEDIYLAAGILNLRGGYSINKVVEMLRSEHMRGLSKEMKRAAVLMALDAAGISVAEVSNDARARQDALDAYEAGQKKQAEAEWARKAEQIAQIQAELEHVQQQYAERISRHRDAVTREKSAFSHWQAAKQQESQRMAEAAELCLKASMSDAQGSRPDVNMASASNRTM